MSNQSRVKSSSLLSACKRSPSYQTLSKYLWNKMFLRSFVDSVNYLNIDFRCENCVCQQGGEFQILQSVHGIPVNPS